MKDLILSKVSQEEIFRRYGADPYLRGKFRSPLRKDNNPSCSWYRRTYSGKIYLKDWSTDETIDCFAFVGKLYNESYSEVIQRIARDFGIVKNGKVTIEVTPKNSPPPVELDRWNGITFQLNKDFDDFELEYWSQYLITEETLEKFNVSSVKALYLDGRKVGASSLSEPCFCYDYKTSNKFYSPYSKLKWLGSAKTTDVIGEEQLGEDKIKKIILTKSQKDVMVLSELGLSAISFQGEGYRISVKLAKKLLALLQKHEVQEIIVLYDNDNAGVKGTVNILAELNKLVKEHDLKVNLSYKFLDPVEGADVKIKDVSDLVAYEVSKGSNKNYIEVLVRESLSRRTFVYVNEDKESIPKSSS